MMAAIRLVRERLGDDAGLKKTMTEVRKRDVACFGCVSVVFYFVGRCGGFMGST